MRINLLGRVPQHWNTVRVAMQYNQVFELRTFASKSTKYKRHPGFNGCFSFQYCCPAVQRIVLRLQLRNISAVCDAGVCDAVVYDAGVELRNVVAEIT